MALRFQCKAAAVAQAGTTFNHLLAAVPDEWKFNPRGPTPGTCQFYVVSAPTSTVFIVAASGAAGTADVFVCRNHTIIR